MTISTELRKLNQDSGWIELYTLDATVLGGSVYNFTNHISPSGTNIVFGGTTYSALPIMTDGWDFTSTGTTPKPTLTVSNVNKTLLSAVVTLGDLVGAKLTRLRTYEKFLDAATFTRVNLSNYSEALEGTGWGRTATITANQTNSPLGIATGDLMTASAINTGAYNVSATGLHNTTYTVSIYAKAGTQTVMNFRLCNQNETYVANYNFNLSAGTVSYVGLIGFTGNSAAIQDVGGGWFRCSITGTTPASGVTNVGGYMRLALTGTVYLWGLQTELGSVATDYQYTATTHQPFADSSQFIGPDVYVIEQKTAHNKNVIQWQMTSILDRMGMKLPRRQVLKDKGFPGVARTRIR